MGLGGKAARFATGLLLLGLLALGWGWNLRSSTRSEPEPEPARTLTSRPGVQLYRSAGPATLSPRAWIRQRLPHTHMRARPTQRLPSGGRVLRLQQQRGGVPVLGGEAVLLLDRRGRVQAASSETLPGPAVDTHPRIGRERVGRIARAYAARVYGQRQLHLDPPRLWIYQPRLVGAPGPRLKRLVWQLEIRSSSGPAPLRRQLLIDAGLGSVVLDLDLMQTALQRRICDAANSATGVPCLNPVRSEGDAATGVNDVNLAYQYSGDTYQFFAAQGRDSLDGNGMALKSTVRYCPSVSSCPYQNAYWNGSQMVYGAGFAAADDVVGHELSHGVTDFSSHLFYYAQSGAINESLSDIFGELIDLGNGSGTDTAAVRWKMGEDIPSIGAIRDLKNPPAFNDPDRMGSTYYTADTTESDAGGVHTNSGVGNKTAYLITDGDSFNGQTVTGLGESKSARLWYTASQLLRSGSDYADLADALDVACSALQGAAQLTASDCQQVSKATLATELRSVPTKAPVTRAPVCADGQTVTDVWQDDFSGGPSAAWTRSATIGSSRWYWASENNGVIDAHYSPLGSNNLWGYNQTGRSDTSISMSNPVQVPASGARLRLRHAWGFEDSTNHAYDGGVLEYSADGGPWTDAGSLITEGGYNGTITSTYDNPLKGRPAWVRESNGYSSSRLNLTSLAGQSVRFRFRIGTDTSGDDYGWFVAQVRLYSCSSSDTQAPETIWDSAPPARTAATTPAISFHASEPGSFQCNLDSGGWSSCSSPLTLTGLSAGSHQLQVRAIDLADNTDPSPLSASWTVDTQPPDTQLLSGPDPVLLIGQASWSFVADDPAASFQCRLDGGSWSTCSSPHTRSPLSDGSHSFQVRAVDDVGNADPTPASSDFQVSGTGPVSSLLSRPALYSSSPNVSFSWSVNPVGTPSQCQLDGGGWFDCISPYDYPALADGLHQFQLRSTDTYGRVESPQSYDFWVDTVAPSTTAESGPAPLLASSQASASFSTSEPGGFQCQLDGGGWSNCASPWQGSGLGAGQHQLQVRAVDRAGNVDPQPISWSWQVDLQGPAVTFVQVPASPSRIRQPRISFRPDEADARLQCQLDDGAWNTCTSPWSPNQPLSDGPHQFRVRSLDELGNLGTTQQTSWTVDTQSPRIRLLRFPRSTRSSRVRFVFASPEPVSWQCRLDRVAWSSCRSPQGYTVRRGAHRLRLRARDQAGNASELLVRFRRR